MKYNYEGGKTAAETRCQVLVAQVKRVLINVDYRKRVGKETIK
jgi:hypothetical protein